MDGLKRLILLSIMNTFLGCNNAEQAKVIESSHGTIKYARGFNIESYPGYKKVTITRLFKGSTSEKVYYLTRDDKNDIPQNGIRIQVPVSKMVCSSTTHLPALVLLNEVNSLAGFPSVNYISSPEIRARIETGNVRDLGSENGLNLEGIVELSPDLMMGYLLTGDSKLYDKIESSGVPVVINSDYLEETPLGRAEWLKFTAALFNKEEMADSIFSAIEKEYLAIKDLAGKVNYRPTVFGGVMYGGTWFMPGGKSFAGIFLEDAGGNFLWSDTAGSGSLELSFESVLEKAHDAEYWIGASNFKSKADMSQSDKRYELFQAFKQDRIYTYTLNVTVEGGNDFFETAYARPDWVLSDMVKIMHPDLLKHKSLHFFQKID
jgi:iron complex transport system substrate-binding protein